MQKLLFLLLFTPLALCAGTPLQFTIRPVFEAGSTRLQVSIEFEGAANGVSYLAYQDNQFGEPHQMSFIRFPQQDPQVDVRKEPDSNRFVVRHAPGKSVRVVYEVLDLQGSDQPFYQYCCYKPILHKSYFHLQSGHLFAQPTDYWTSPEDRQTIRLRWVDFPPNWILHNSFGPGESQTVSLTNSEFNQAIFVGGDFRRHLFEVQGKPVYLLTRGQWSQFTDDTLVQLLRRTVEGHRAFWNDFSDSIYTVTFLPINDAPWTETSKSTSTGGSGLTNSFLSFATDNPGVSYDLVRYVWVHELMHRWIGTKIQNAAEEKQYWFSEGFTEYFTLKNSLRYGLIDVPQFLQGLNQFSSEHYSSPNRKMPNDSMTYEHFWNGGKEWEKLPYRRGCLYAFYLDNQIRAQSKGEHNLDQMMRGMLAAIQAHPTQKLDHAFFLKMIRPYAGKSSGRHFHQYIELGQPIDFRKMPLPAGMEVEVKDITMHYGPSKDIITRTEVLKDIPVFKATPGGNMERLKAEILR